MRMVKTWKRDHPLRMENDQFVMIEKRSKKLYGVFYDVFLKETGGEPIGTCKLYGIFSGSPFVRIHVARSPKIKEKIDSIQKLVAEKCEPYI